MDLRLDRKIQDSLKKYLMKLGIVVLIALIAELAVFNIRTFQSMGYVQRPVEAGDILAVENGHLLDTGDIELNDGEENLVIILRDTDAPINNLYLDIWTVDEAVSEDYEDNVCSVTVLSKDGYSIAQKKIVNGIPSSRYIWLEDVNNTGDLRVEISTASGAGRIFRINNMVYNQRRGLEISLIRIFSVIVLMTVIWLALFDNSLWQADCVTFRRWKVVLPLVLFTVIAIVSFWWPMQNPLVKSSPQNEYALLARALMRGETFVGEAGDLVKSCADELVFWNIESNEVKFDYACYDGKYYVYFGILPCVIFFLPYYIITGKDLPVFVPVVILCLTLAAEIYVLLGMLIRRFYRNTPYAARLLMTAAAAGGMYLVLFISLADHYVIAIAAGVALLLAGIMFWLRAISLFDGNVEKISKDIFFWVAGSLCMSSVSLCRPTLLLMGFALLLNIVPACRSHIRKMNRKRFIEYVAAIAAPYVVLALICMYYNFIRFGSIFEFGTRYNMTTIPLDGRLGLGAYPVLRIIYEYFFAPAFFTPAFPFCVYQQWEQIMEGGVLFVVIKPDAGLFSSAPVLWLGGLCILYRKKLKEKGLWMPLISLVLCALVIMIFSTGYTCFITDRYTLEISWILFVAAFIGMLEMFEDIRFGAGNGFADAVCFLGRILLLMTAAYGFLMFIAQKGSLDLVYGNTELYYRIFYAANPLL